MSAATYEPNARRRLSHWTLSAVAALTALAPSGADAFSIRISGSASEYQCSRTVVPFTPTVLYVSASLNPIYPTDPGLPGITSAVFRLGGFDSSSFLVLQSQPAPGAMLEGNPVGVDGCRVSFPTCQSWGAPGCSVALLEVTILAVLQQVPPTTITVGPAAHVCQAMVPEPFVTGCDDTVTHVCATGLGVCINDPAFCPFCPVSEPPNNCELTVMPESWSKIKSFYKQ